MRVFIALLGACAFASIVPATPALAGGSIVIGDGPCGGFVPVSSGEITLENSLVGGDSHQVVKGNTITMVCHFDIPDDRLPSKGVKQSDFTCQTRIDGITYTAYEQRMAASPGGRAVLTCKFVLPTATLTTKKK